MSTKSKSKDWYKQQAMKAKAKQFAGFDPNSYADASIAAAKARLEAGATHTITDFAAGEHGDEGGLNYGMNWKQQMAQQMDGAVISAQTCVEVDLDEAKGKLWDAVQAEVEGALAAYNRVYDYKLSILLKEDEDE